MIKGLKNPIDFINLIYGFFAEVKFNRQLVDKGYQMEAISSSKINSRSNFINFDGSEPLASLNLEPQSITILQKNGRITPNFEVDAIAEDSNGENHYIEHKINLSSFINSILS
jgi:hypothetical protein